MRRASVACLVSLIALSAGSAYAQTQTGVTQWQFESVTQAPATCQAGLKLVGFDHDPSGNPVLAWQQDCTSSGQPRVFWTRKTGGVWSFHEYISDRRYQGGGDGDLDHALIVLPGDGTPLLVFTAPGPFNELNTYSVNLDASLSGAASVYLENLVGPQTGVTAAYAPAALASASAAGGGQLATGYYLTDDLGSVRINGTTISTQVYRPRVSYAVAPDTGQHLLWSSGTTLYYTSRAPRAPTYQTRVLYTNLDRTGGEVKLVADSSGVLHALVRGYDPDSAFDGGTLVYFRSTDNGATWSTPEHIDPFDAVPANPGAHSDVSLTVDASGVPSVVYWKSQQQLYYARRDGAGNTWTRSLVASRPNVTASRATVVDIDAGGNPVVAYFDQPSSRLLLARPVPSGVIVPVDLALTGVVAPAAVAPGGPLTYTLTVENQGTTTVQNATLTLRVPPGVTLGTATPATATPGTWTLVSLPAFTFTTVTVTASAPLAQGDVIATATVGSRATDADPSDDAVLLQSTVQSQACFVNAAGLTGLFRGDRNADNDIAAEADGVAKGGVSYTPAAVGDGFLLDGTTGVVSVQANNENAFYPGTGSFTVQAFVRTTSAQAQMVASRHECVSPYCGLTTWYLQIANGIPAVFIRDRGGNVVSFGGTRVVNDGALHHVGFVIDRAAAQARLYVDGVRDGVQPLTLVDVSHDIPLPTPLLIGAFQQTNGILFRYFDGVIDELAIAKRAYSDAEMAQTAAILTDGACVVQPAPGADADVAAAISVTPIDVSASGAIEYVLRATNVGAGTASNVSLTQDLPTGAAVVSTVPPGTPAGAGSSTYALGSLPGGTSAWVVVQATAPPTPGPATSTVTSSSVSDGNVANDTASATVVVTRGACILVPVGLLANWPLNGTLLDQVGTYNGTLKGTAVFAPGRLHAGLALQLDGNGYVEVPDAPTLRPAQFTVGAWVAPEFQAPGVPLTIVSKGSSGTDPLLPAGTFTWWFGAADGLALFSVRQGATTTTLQGQTGVGGDWHHVAASYDGTTIRLYVDGVEEDSRVLTLPLHYDTGTAPLLIGDLAGAASMHRFTGLLDDVTLHSRVLSPGEIQALVDGPSASCLANTAPTIAQPADRVNDEGDAAVLQLQAADANADHLTFAAVNLPPGLSIDSSYGLINGTVDTRGVYTVTVYATDGIGVAEATFTWTVNGNSPPSLAPGFPPVDREGDSVSRALKTLVTATDPDNDTLAFTVTGLPPGLSYSSTTGLVTGIIPYGAAGTYPVQVAADDGQGGTASLTVTWTVLPQVAVVVDIAEAVVVTDTLVVEPSTLVELVETVVVTDTLQVDPAVFVDIGEQVAVTDQVAATSALLVDIAEQVHVTDGINAVPAVLVEIVEQVSVADQLSVLPSAVIDVTEVVAVSDVAVPLPSALIDVLERVAVADGPLVIPPLVIDVVEHVAVADANTVLPSALLDIVEAIRVGDGPAVQPAALVDVVESVQISDQPLVVPPNRPPVVTARPWLAPAGPGCVAPVAPQWLDDGSYDPEGGPLTFALVPPGPFGLGLHKIQLVATDTAGLSGAALTDLTVRDLIAPAMSASLSPISRTGRRYRVNIAVSDECDPAPAVNAFMVGPPIASASQTVINTPNASRVTLQFNVATRRVVGIGPRAQVLQALATMRTRGGAPVVNGQTLVLRTRPPSSTLFDFEFVGGVLQAISAPGIELRVTATDAAGNSATVTAVP